MRLLYQRSTWTMTLALLFSLLTAEFVILSETSASVLEAEHQLHPTECGLIGEVSSRILGGNDAVQHELPWMVYIDIPRKENQKIKHSRCGGSIISSQIILTAAHCFKPDVLWPVWVRAGAPDVSRDGQDFQTEEILLHSHFVANDSHILNDIALLKISSPVTNFTESVRPICLPPHNLVFTGATVHIAGWGLQNDTETSDFLQNGHTTVISNERCRAVHPGITVSQICAGYSPHESHTCAGDSGAPMMFRHIDRYYVIGLVSFSQTKNCSEISEATVFTRITEFLPWIRQTVRNMTNR